MNFRLKKLKWLKWGKRLAPIQPPIQNFLVEVDLPQAQANDSADVLRQKAATMFDSFFTFQSQNSVQRDRYTWLDVAQKLAQNMSPGEIVSRDDLYMLVEQLQNPNSELYLQALELILKIA